MENKNVTHCVCCGAAMSPETNTMICRDCADQLRTPPAYNGHLKSANSRIFKREFKRVQKAISRAACCGYRDVKIYVREVVVVDIIDRLIHDGFKATQVGCSYDGPIFIAW